jgi:pyruvate dehydrogenase E1 component alpha subunit
LPAYQEIHLAAATETVAERAPAWAAVGERVDGNDVEAVANAFETAVLRARSGGGPTLIEATCYRFRGHFEGDADTYRSEQDKTERRAKDPLAITRKKLTELGLATSEELEAMENSVKNSMNLLLSEVRQDPMPSGEHAMKHVFVGA